MRVLLEASKTPAQNAANAVSAKMQARCWWTRAEMDGNACICALRDDVERIYSVSSDEARSLEGGRYCC